MEKRKKLQETEKITAAGWCGGAGFHANSYGEYGGYGKRARLAQTRELWFMRTHAENKEKRGPDF